MISREKALKIRAIIQGFGEQLSELVRTDYVDRATLRICEILDPEVHEPAAEGAMRPVEVTMEEWEAIERYVFTMLAEHGGGKLIVTYDVVCAVLSALGLHPPPE